MVTHSTRRQPVRHVTTAIKPTQSGEEPNTLANWITKVKERGDVPDKPLTVSERAELEKLRKDYAQA
jgi:hypothetical protein